MAITKEDVTKAAQLARIDITKSEADTTLEQLKKVFLLIEDMKTIDTDEIEPMAHAQDISTRLREDVVTEHEQRENLQANAPAIDNALFLVPRVID